MFYLNPDAETAKTAPLYTRLIVTLSFSENVARTGISAPRHADKEVISGVATKPRKKAITLRTRIVSVMAIFR